MPCSDNLWVASRYKGRLPALSVCLTDIIPPALSVLHLTGHALALGGDQVVMHVSVFARLRLGGARMQILQQQLAAS